MDEIKDISARLSKVQSNIAAAFSSAGYVVGLLIGIVGLVMIMTEINVFRKISQVENWPILKNQGKINTSYLEQTEEYNSYSIFIITHNVYQKFYRTRVSFNYKIDGTEHTGTKLSFYEPWLENPIIADMENNIYKPGNIVDIRVNPNNANEAYIINKKYNNYSKLSIGIIMALIGFYAIYKL